VNVPEDVSVSVHNFVRHLRMRATSRNVSTSFSLLSMVDLLTGAFFVRNTIHDATDLPPMQEFVLDYSVVQYPTPPYLT
jgi:hypothetical protein